MKQTLFDRFRLLNHFFLSRSKFDIHSPFVYRIYSEILKDKTAYPEYHAQIVKNINNKSPLSVKDNRLLYRLSRYVKPKNMLILGASGEKPASFMALGSPDGFMISIRDSTGLMGEHRKFDMVLVLDDLPGDGNQDYFSRIMQHIHSDSVMIFCNIHGSKEMHELWNEIKNHSSVTLTIDLFSLGLVFCKEGLAKEEFILRY